MTTELKWPCPKCNHPLPGANKPCTECGCDVLLCLDSNNATSITSRNFILGFATLALLSMVTSATFFWLLTERLRDTDMMRDTRSAIDTAIRLQQSTGNSIDVHKAMRIVNPNYSIRMPWTSAIMRVASKNWLCLLVSVVSLSMLSATTFVLYLSRNQNITMVKYRCIFRIAIGSLYAFLISASIWILAAFAVL
jgi:hypothetical protein